MKQIGKFIAVPVSLLTQLIGRILVTILLSAAAFGVFLAVVGLIALVVGLIGYGMLWFLLLGFAWALGMALNGILGVLDPDTEKKFEPAKKALDTVTSGKDELAQMARDSMTDATK